MGSHWLRAMTTESSLMSTWVQLYSQESAQDGYMSTCIANVVGPYAALFTIAYNCGSIEQEENNCP